MENKENNKTAMWPIYVDKETGKIIDTVTNMMQPIDPNIVSACKEMVDNTQTESDYLKQFMIESYLTCNTDVIKNNIDFIILACDNNTKEIINFINPSQDVPQNERMKRLIDLLDNACVGVDSNGNANDLMTIVGNVMARYCAADPANEKSFNDLVQFWKNQISSN